MSKFVKICTPRSPHTPQMPPSHNRKCFPFPPPHHQSTAPHPTFPHNHPHSETLNFPQKLNYLVSNTPKLNNFNNLIA